VSTCKKVEYDLLVLLHTKILKGLRGSNVEIREEYGRCLGELVAIDPGK